MSLITFAAKTKIFFWGGGGGGRGGGGGGETNKKSVPKSTGIRF